MKGSLETSAGGERMGPLDGVQVVEIASLAPAPFGCMVLADLGADVLRVDRADIGGPDPGRAQGPLSRGRRSVQLNLKDPEGIGLLLALLEDADVLVEGFRPGVAERLGFGPEECARRNPRLIYARMTGWGQDGPLAPTAGHDIDYIAISGALGAIGREGERPVPPINLVGDFGGGGMLLAFGVTAALLESRGSGQGQVVDAAMTDGSASLLTMAHSFLAAGLATEERGTNLLDTGAHFYEVYEAADGRHVAVGAIEPRFYAALLDGLGLDPDELPAQMDRAAWPSMKERLAACFRLKTRDEWAAHFEGTEACVAPVLSPLEARDHPHNVARGTFVEVAGVRQPGPAPRFSRTPSQVASPPEAPGSSTTSALSAWGVEADRITALRDAGALSGR
jgi:alpha-methylacyl-CoA racemase